MTETQSVTMGKEKFHIIIDSIGSADPSASKMLSDVLGTPVELVVKALYNTPTVLFSDIDEALAKQCHELLEKLGMISHIQSVSEPLPEKGESVDVGIYVHDIRDLSKITNELAHFLGCTVQEALNMLLTDPCVVLGGVSISTAEALCQRLDTEVIISNPEKDKYTLFVDFDGENTMLGHKLKSYLKHLKISSEYEETGRIENLDYRTAQDIWKKFQSTGMLKMTNQSFQRFEVDLVGVDRENDTYKAVLMEEVGIPEKIMDQVLDNLPIQLYASANGKTVSDQLKRYAAAGMECVARPVKPNNYKLIIEEISDLAATKKILAQFLGEENLPTKTGKWECPRPLGDLIFRCISAELEMVGCEVDYDYFIK